MKRLLYNLLIYSSFALPLSARTWTSADGAKTFEAKYHSYNKTTGKVALDKGIKQITFDIHFLSETDKKWLNERLAKDLKEKKAKNNPNYVNVTKDLHGSLSKLKGKKIRRYKLKKNPEYYLIYYSASW